MSFLNHIKAKIIFLGKGVHSNSQKEHVILPVKIHQYIVFYKTILIDQTKSPNPLTHVHPTNTFSTAKESILNVEMLEKTEKYKNFSTRSLNPINNQW